MEIPSAAKAEKHHILSYITEGPSIRTQTRTGSGSHASQARSKHTEDKKQCPQTHFLMSAGRDSEQTGGDNLFNYLKLLNFKAITLVTQVLPQCSPPMRVFEGSQEKTLCSLPASRASRERDGESWQAGPWHREQAGAEHAACAAEQVHPRH